MKKKKIEFSKIIIIFETLLVGLLTYKCCGWIDKVISLSFDGSLPYLSTLLTAAWAAYGTSVSFYYNKAKAENVEKITKGDCWNEGQTDK